MTDLLRSVSASFSRDYAEARRKFLKAARAAGGKLRSYDNTLTGPEGEALAADCAWFGPRNAEKVAVTLSATHGVEGFCGSGAQIDWLRGDRRLPRGTAMLVVHAINPHGFAWIRRVTEEGVDMNRNFVDFTQPLPENPGYDELADAIVPAALEGPIAEAAKAKLQAYGEKHGARALGRAVSAGQYKHPKGLFFGGTAPTWAHRTHVSIIDDYGLDARKHVALIDYHTGLGRYGYGELICCHDPKGPAYARARAWWGESVSNPADGSSSSDAEHGFNVRLWERRLGPRKLTHIAVEYGTYDTWTVVRPALTADHWLHAQPDFKWSSPVARKIKAQIRRAFYPDQDDWREMVLWRSRQVVRQALAGLART